MMRRWALLLLVLMAIVGGMIANRGITLYLHVRRAEYEERQQQEKNPPT